ncbi:hypothetical protein GOODEAATRI_006548 [Goodea atripinnis]|uniref:Uncharacterized protein n=1 Tax=Goodea atripinnis TaxID=208336 RepID=A0ABV0NI00_9TELE
MALEVPFLWPGQMMPAPWANTTDPEKLVQFLQASVTDRRRKGTFFVSQVVLTPKASTVMKGVASGLRETITERYILQRDHKNKLCYACVQHNCRPCKSCSLHQLGHRAIPSWHSGTKTVATPEAPAVSKVA